MESIANKSKVDLTETSDEKCSVKITFTDANGGIPIIEYSGTWSGFFLQKAVSHLYRSYRQRRRDLAREGTLKLQSEEVEEDETTTEEETIKENSDA